jgi:hypothetical protein
VIEIIELFRIVSIKKINNLIRQTKKLSKIFNFLNRYYYLKNRHSVFIIIINYRYIVTNSTNDIPESNVFCLVFKYSFRF